VDLENQYYNSKAGMPARLDAEPEVLDCCC